MGKHSGPIPSDRRCVTCGSPDTYVNPTRGVAVWHKHPVKGYNCHRCHTHSSQTKKYSAQKSKEYRDRQGDEYKKRTKEYLKRWYNDNPDKAREYYLKNYYDKDGKKKKHEYYEAHRDDICKYKKEHRKAHHGEYISRDHEKYIKSKRLIDAKSSVAHKSKKSKNINPKK